MNPEQERRHRTHEGMANLQPPEYEPPLDARHYARPGISRPFLVVLAGSVAVALAALVGIWWLTS